jgi:hypothetical protein
MRAAVRVAADLAAVSVGLLAAPFLGLAARHRLSLPRFQALGDRLGFQLRSSHYYEPTYREADLPPVTAVERMLPGLDMNEAVQLELLEECHFADELRAIPLNGALPGEFGYQNRMYSYGDAEMLYNIVRLKKPRMIMEIGSGHSTLMARLAIDANRRDDPAYQCEQVCIEPYERPWLEAVGVTLIRERVERIELDLFQPLAAGDILFIDSSHVIRPWGDVLREFQEIIPRLRPGVLVQVHDVFTPHDYPERWLRRERRLWNEQYLLETFLAFNDAFEVVCAANWLKHHHRDPLAAACPVLAAFPDHEPGAFWFRRRTEPLPGARNG